jgi:hypothetical protein
LEKLNETIFRRRNWWATCTGSPASSGLLHWRCDGAKLMRRYCLYDVRVAVREETTMQDVVESAIALRETISKAKDDSTCLETMNWLANIDDDLVNAIQQGKEYVDEKTEKLNVIIEECY